MPRQTLIVVLWFCFAVASHGQGVPGLPKADKIDVQLDKGGKFVGSTNDGIVRAIGGVKVVAGNTVLTAKEVEVNTKTHDFVAKGNVKIAQGKFVCEGEELSGNFKTNVVRAVNHHVTMHPWFFKATETKRDEQSILHARNVKMSTCEQVLEDKFFVPWQFQAKEVSVNNKEEYIVLKHMVPRLFGIPFFYLPYIKIPTDMPPIEIEQGRTGDWGYWLGVGIRHDVGDYVRNKYFIEHRQKRGEAFGIKTDIANVDRLRAHTMLYYMNDREPLSDYVAPDGTIYNGRYETRSLDRYRVRLFGDYKLMDDLTLMAKLDLQSDNDMIFEFFRHTYNVDPEPSSFLDFGFLQDRYEASLNYRPKVNYFNSVVERLPEARVDLPRQKLGKSPLYYQGETSMAKLRMSFREYDLPRFDSSPDNSDYSTTRFDAAHTLYLPMKLGWLNIVPRAGVRMTWYEDTSLQAVTEADLNANIAADDRRDSAGSTETVTSYDDAGGDATRWAAEYGVELNFKLHREWLDFNSDILDVNGVRHTIMPYLNYIYIPEPDEHKDNLYFFDEIDRIDRVNMLRFGLMQTLVGRRGVGHNQKTVSIFRMENFLDYYVDPEDGLENEGDFGTVIELLPSDWFYTDLKMLNDSEDWRLNVFSTSMRFGKSDKLNLGLGYTYRNDFSQRYNYSFGSDLRRIFSSTVFPLAYTETDSLSATLNIPIGDKTKLITSASYDFLSNEIATQRIELKRTVDCWAFAMAWTKNGDTEGVELTIYLTAFPGSGIGYNYDYHEAD